MKSRRFSLALSALCAVLWLLGPAPRARAEGPAPAQVTLPLPAYEDLRKRDERPGLTVVESLRVSGSFQRRDLALTLSGRGTGRLPGVALLLPSPSGVRVHGCDGDALISLGEGEGAVGYQLTPLRDRFTLRCRLTPRGSDRLELRVGAAVLHVESQVEDGEFVQSDAEGQQRTFSIVRLTGGQGETLRPSATARYRLSLYPDETRFRYQIDVRNPNRSTQPFELTLQSGEVVQQVDAQARYEIDRSAANATAPRYRFELPPGERTLVLTGTLSGARFAPPVSASVQYVLLESHPLLRPQPSGAARRISPAETQISAEFRGAQAFLLGEKEELRWQVTRLAALRTTSFAVRDVTHRFFLSADGRVLGETDLNIDNQGAPDLTLPMQPPLEPTFASLRGEPVYLTRNEAGQLWLPISQGEQRVLVQHRQGLAGRLGLAAARLYLPQLGALASRASVELRFPREWRPLYAEFSPDAQLLAGDGGDLVLWLVLLLVAERCLYVLGVGGRRRLLVLLAPAALTALGALGVTAAATVVLGLWLWPALRRLGRASLFGAGVAVMGLFGVAFLVLAASAVRYSPPSSPSYGKMANEVSVASRADLPRENKPEPTPAAPGANAPASYQGLPAKFEMPSGDRQVYFFREMLNTEAPRPVYVVLLARRVEALLQLGALLLAALAILLQRRELRDGLVALWRRASNQPPPLPADLAVSATAPRSADLEITQEQLPRP